MQNLTLVSSFGDMSSQNLLWKPREQVIKFGYLPHLKTSFYVQSRSSRPKIDPHVNFSNFQAKEIFFIFKIFGPDVSMRKEQQQPP